ncbi:MAG TPA: MBL fold metallo-hydrolase, partial [Nitrospirota bacterium]
MKITVLGCGTSFGVPMIACDCRVCRSDDPRNKRMRSSILVSANGKNILVDTTTDLRQQSIANDIRHIDAVLYTHPHAEHLNGIDELRRFNIVQGTGIPCYGSPDTLEEIRQIFRYIFLRQGRPGWQPDLSTNPVTGPFELFGVPITPIPLIHGRMPVYG